MQGNSPLGVLISPSVRLQFGSNQLSRRHFLSMRLADKLVVCEECKAPRDMVTRGCSRDTFPVGWCSIGESCCGWREGGMKITVENSG